MPLQVYLSHVPSEIFIKTKANVSKQFKTYIYLCLYVLWFNLHQHPVLSFVRLWYLSPKCYSTPLTGSLLFYSIKANERSVPHSLLTNWLTTADVFRNRPMGIRIFFNTLWIVFKVQPHVHRPSDRMPQNGWWTDWRNNLVCLVKQHNLTP